MKEIPIFSQKLAGYLMQDGYRLLRLAPNRKRPFLHVFYFEESEGLLMKISGYSAAN